MEINVGDLFCYDCYKDGDYGYWYEEEIEIATEDNRYFWEVFNNKDWTSHKLKWIIKKEQFESNAYKIEKER